MITLKLKRFRTGKDGTFGELQDSLNNHLYYTVECPCGDNEPNINCVPPGWYETEWYQSPLHGLSLQLKNVVGGRKYCQIHSANWAYQLHGCIAIGRSLSMIQSSLKSTKIMGVSSSKASIKEFKSKYKDNSVRFIIENNF